MRRINPVVALAATVATLVALTVGSALAKGSDSAQTKYADKIVNGYQYFAFPLPNDTGEGIGRFRADRVEGQLPGELDTTIYYTGAPGPNVTSEVIRGTWILCSAFEDPPRDLDTGALIEPECASGSAIQLTGTVSGGRARWDALGTYIPAPSGVVQVWIGVAEVKATLRITGGTVYGVPVDKGSGKLEGTLDHLPLLQRKPATITGDVTLKF